MLLKSSEKKRISQILLAFSLLGLTSFNLSGQAGPLDFLQGAKKKAEEVTGAVNKGKEIINNPGDAAKKAAQQAVPDGAAKKILEAANQIKGGSGAGQSATSSLTKPIEKPMPKKAEQYGPPAPQYKAGEPCMHKCEGSNTSIVGESNGAECSPKAPPNGSKPKSFKDECAQYANKSMGNSVYKFDEDMGFVSDLKINPTFPVNGGLGNTSDFFKNAQEYVLGGAGGSTVLKMPTDLSSIKPGQPNLGIIKPDLLNKVLGSANSVINSGNLTGDSLGGSLGGSVFGPILGDGIGKSAIVNVANGATSKVLSDQLSKVVPTTMVSPAVQAAIGKAFGGVGSNSVQPITKEQILKPGLTDSKLDYMRKQDAARQIR